MKSTQEGGRNQSIFPSFFLCYKTLNFVENLDLHHHSQHSGWQTFFRLLQHLWELKSLGFFLIALYFTEHSSSTYFISQAQQNLSLYWLLGCSLDSTETSLIRLISERFTLQAEYILLVIIHKAYNPLFWHLGYWDQYKNMVEWATYRCFTYRGVLHTGYTISSIRQLIGE